MFINDASLPWCPLCTFSTYLLKSLAVCCCVSGVTESTKLVFCCTLGNERRHHHRLANSRLRQSQRITFTTFTTYKSQASPLHDALTVLQLSRGFHRGNILFSRTWFWHRWLVKATHLLVLWLEISSIQYDRLWSELKYKTQILLGILYKM